MSVKKMLPHHSSLMFCFDDLYCPACIFPQDGLHANFLPLQRESFLFHPCSALLSAMEQQSVIVVNLLWVVPYRAPLTFLTLLGFFRSQLQDCEEIRPALSYSAKRKIKGEECDLYSQPVRPTPASEKEVLKK